MPEPVTMSLLAQLAPSLISGGGALGGGILEGIGASQESKRQEKLLREQMEREEEERKRQFALDKQLGQRNLNLQGLSFLTGQLGRAQEQARLGGFMKDLRKAFQ